MDTPELQAMDLASALHTAHDMGQIITNDTKAFSPLLPEEPTFTIRAKDQHAIEVLRAIRHMGLYNGVGAGMDPVIIRFEAWRAANPDSVALPD